MDLTERVNEIAMQAVKDSAQSDLRALSPDAKHQRLLDCLDEVKAMLDQAHDREALLRFAAAAIYSSNFHLHTVQGYEDTIDGFLNAIAVVPSRGMGKARIINDALAKLRKERHLLISVLIDAAQGIVPTLKASASGQKGKLAAKQVRDFAIQRYKERTWQTTSQAKRVLWPGVKAEALRLKWVMSDDQGPITLYNWLLTENKTTRSTS